MIAGSPTVSSASTASSSERDEPAPRRSQADLVHRLPEQLTILGLGDRLLAGADQLDAVALEDTRAGERHRDIERRLAAHCRQQRLRPLPGDDLGDHFRGDRLDIGRVGQLRVGHDRRRVRVDQHDPVAFAFQRLAGLRAGIIEFAGLPDHDRAGADDQDGVEVGAPRHSRSISRDKPSRTDRWLSCGPGLASGWYCDRKHRLADHPQSLRSCCRTAKVRRLDAARQALGLHDEAVVLAGDLDLAGQQVLDRVVGAPVAARHLARPPAERQRQQLVAEADAEDRLARGDQIAQHRHGICPGRRRVARAVRQEDAVRPVAQDILGRGGRRHHGDPAAMRGEHRRMLRFAP